MATMKPARYSVLAIALHWVMALMILGNLAGGFVAHDLLQSAIAADRALGRRIIGWHMSLGLFVLALTLARLAIRLLAGVPPLPDHMTPTERALARISHAGFYGLMLAVPLAGWAMVSARDADATIALFGLFAWPRLPVPARDRLAEAAGEAHELLAIAMIGLLLLHLVGALKHHFLDQDDVLARMLPFVRRRAGREARAPVQGA